MAHVRIGIAHVQPPPIRSQRLGRQRPEGVGPGQYLRVHAGRDESPLRPQAGLPPLIPEGRLPLVQPFRRHRLRPGHSGRSPAAPDVEAIPGVHALRTVPVRSSEIEGDLPVGIDAEAPDLKGVRIQRQGELSVRQQHRHGLPQVRLRGPRQFQRLFPGHLPPVLLVIDPGKQRPIAAIGGIDVLHQGEVQIAVRGGGPGRHLAPACVPVGIVHIGLIDRFPRQQSGVDGLGRFAPVPGDLRDLQNAAPVVVILGVHGNGGGAATMAGHQSAQGAHQQHQAQQGQPSPPPGSGEEIAQPGPEGPGPAVEFGGEIGVGCPHSAASFRVFLSCRRASTMVCP